MPESLNVCCLFDEAPTNCRSMFLKLFEADAAWMGRPDNFMVLGIHSGVMNEGLWPLPASVSEQLSDEDLLIVYSDWNTSPLRFRSSIILQKRDGRAVCTLGFPVLLLQHQEVASVEARFYHISETAASIGACAVFIGPEMELDPALSASEAVSSALDRDSLTTWMIASDEHLPKDVRPFEVVAKNKRVLLRHPEAVGRVGLSLTARSAGA